MTSRRARRSLRPDLSRRQVLLVAAAVLGLAVLWLAFQAAHATIALSKASDQAVVVREALASGDQELAERSIERLTELAGTARDSSDGPLWWVAGQVPVLGRNAEALTTLSRALDVAVSEALPPIAGISDQLEADVFTIRDGRIDLSVVEELAPALRRSNAAYADAVEAAAALDTGRLTGRLSGPARQLQGRLVELGTVLDAADRAAEVLPEVLGAEGPRTYLLMVQSNAETRPLGGVPGNWLVVRADQGVVSIDVQGSSSDLPALPEPATELTAEELDLYGATFGQDFRNTLLSPHFPRSAEVARAVFAANQGITVDGVVAVDPVALSYLMVGTGPIALPDGIVLTAENAVGGLLNRAYAAFPGGAEQNAFFESAARAIFDVFVAGQGDPSTILRSLASAVAERRVLFWAADESVQEQLGGSSLAGEFFGDDGDAPSVGVYLSDRTEAKLQYYLDTTTSVESTRCEDGVPTLTARIRMVSAVPEPAGLPLSILGLAPYAEPGTMVMRLRVYSPTGGTVERVVVDGDEAPLELSREDDRTVAFVELRLPPGETATVAVEMTGAEGQDGEGVLLTSPGIGATPNATTFRTAC